MSFQLNRLTGQKIGLYETDGNLILESLLF